MAWRSLVHCITRSGRRVWGQPVESEAASGRPLVGSLVRVLSGSPFSLDAVLLDEQAEIATVLPPLEPLLLDGHGSRAHYNEELDASEVERVARGPWQCGSGVLCIGLNYYRHAAETGIAVDPARMTMFVKYNSSIIGHGQSIVVPRVAQEPQQVDYEAELAVVIGSACRNVSVERSLDHVLGFTCANDVSARLWQLQWGGGQWCFGKSFDTFTPLGPVLVRPSALPPGGADVLAISTTLNGQTMQCSNTSDMVRNVATIVSTLSQGTTLLPGTVILTGTPEGVGFTRKPPVWLQAGDRVVVAIEHIGALENPVEYE